MWAGLQNMISQSLGGTVTWSSQGGGIIWTHLTEIKGKGRAQPGQYVLTASCQSIARGTLGRCNSILLRARWDKRKASGERKICFSSFFLFQP